MVVKTTDFEKHSWVMEFFFLSLELIPDVGILLYIYLIQASSNNKVPILLYT